MILWSICHTVNIEFIIKIWPLAHRSLSTIWSYLTFQVHTCTRQHTTYIQTYASGHTVVPLVEQNLPVLPPVGGLTNHLVAKCCTVGLADRCIPKQEYFLFIKSVIRFRSSFASLRTCLCQLSVTSHGSIKCHHCIAQKLLTSLRHKLPHIHFPDCNKSTCIFSSS